MRSITQSITRCESQLRLIPVAALRQARILDLINEVTGSPYSFVSLFDDLNRLIGGSMSPILSWRLKLIPKLGPALQALAMSSELLDVLLDTNPGVASDFPDDFYLRSLLYEIIGKPMDYRYVACYRYPTRENGSGVILVVTRDHKNGKPFEPADLRAIKTICDRFSHDLSSIRPGWEHQPSLPSAKDHVLSTDAGGRCSRTSAFLGALITLFYGPLGADPAGKHVLPPAMVADIRKYRLAALSSFKPAEKDFTYAFAVRKRGRVLWVDVRESRKGILTLTCKEDTSRHAQLSRIKTACASLPRDRFNTYGAALALLDGLQTEEEITERAGFARMKSTSAARIISSARKVIADARGQ